MHLALVGDHPELAPRRRHRALRHPHNVPLVLQPVPDQLRHRQHFETMLVTKFDQVRHPRHGAVILHHLTDHPGGNQPGQPRQIHGCLGLPGPHQDATLPCPQRKHVSRPRQILRRRLRIDRNLNSVSPVVRGNSRRHALPRLNRLGKRGPEPRRILRRHRSQPQIIRALLGQRQADQPPPILRHKVDRFGSHVLRGQRQVAFILAVLVVDHHNHPPRVDLLHRPSHIRHDPRIVHSPILRHSDHPGHATEVDRITNVIDLS